MQRLGQQELSQRRKLSLFVVFELDLVLQGAQWGTLLDSHGLGFALLGSRSLLLGECSHRHGIGTAKRSARGASQGEKTWSHF